MAKLDRDQMTALGAVSLLLIACVSAVGLSMQIRSVALQDLADARDALSRVEAHVGTTTRIRGAGKAAAAPPTAFLDAPTQGLAGAQLQAYLSQLIAAQHATLISSGVQPATGADAADAIRIEVTVNTTLGALQTLLYQLESGAPYVFVELLNVQQPGTAARSVTQDPLLHVTLGLRAMWRRGAA